MISQGISSSPNETGPGVSSSAWTDAEEAEMQELLEEQKHIADINNLIPVVSYRVRRRATWDSIIVMRRGVAEARDAGSCPAASSASTGPSSPKR